MRPEAQPTLDATPILARRPLVYLVVPLLFFAAVAPTLPQLEFSGGMENLNIATALELRRDHPDPHDWLIPTLEGEKRFKKPPLTAWLTALAIRPATVKDLSDPNPTIRAKAAKHLAFETRWPALAAACLMLLATYELGRACADPTTGLYAALVAGSTVMFLRFARSAMIDVHLALWVTTANAFLAHAILHRRRYLGCIGAGAALGVAFMIKGPVPIVQSLAPALIFVTIDAWQNRDRRERPAMISWIAPTTLGLFFCCAVALPWYLYVLHTDPQGLSVMAAEATAERGERPSGPAEYLTILINLLPWTVLFVGGVITAFTTRHRGLLLAAALAVLPLLIMACYKDRKQRYMVPVTGPCAVVTAAGFVALARKPTPWNNWDRAAIVQHYGMLVLAGVLFPAAAATGYVKELKTVTGQPWLSRPTGAALTIGLGLALAAAMLVRRHWPAALAAATVLVTLALQAALLPGYARTEPGLSPMRPLADAIWQLYPDADMCNAHPKGKRASVDLSIYLNRITKWVSPDELTNLRPGPRPKVVVMLQGPNDPDPTPPSGWQLVHKVPRDKDFWWAFALPPS